MRRGGGRSKRRKGQKPRIRISIKAPPKSAQSRILSSVSSAALSHYSADSNETENNFRFKWFKRNKDKKKKRKKNENEARKNLRLQFNIWAIYMIGQLNLISLKVDPSTGEMICLDATKYKIRRFLFWCWSAFATSRIFIMAGMTGFAILQGQNEEANEKVQNPNVNLNDTNIENQSSQNEPASSPNVYEMFFMAMVSTIFVIVWYLHYNIALCDNLKVIFLAYNSILEVGVADSSSEEEGEEEDEGNEDIQFDIKGLKKCVLIFLPFVVYAAMLSVPGLLIALPSTPLLTPGTFIVLGFDFHQQWSFQSLGVTWPSFLFFLALAFVDWMIAFFIISYIYIGVFVMMLYIEMMTEHTLKLVEYIRWGLDADTNVAIGIGIADRLMTTVKKLHCAKLQVICFNLGMSQTIFFSKIIALMTGVIGGFGAIKLYAEHPIFASIFFLVFVEGNILFVIIFDTAYQVGENIEALKMEVLTIVGANFKVDDERRMTIERSVRSIQEVGIKSGGFNNMEKESTLLFSDFIIGQIVDLLIAF